MSDINAVVRGSGATRRQVDSWTRSGILHANLDHGRYEYAEMELFVARALARMSEAGIGVSSETAREVAVAIRSNRIDLSLYDWLDIDLTNLILP